MVRIKPMTDSYGISFNRSFMDMKTLPPVVAPDSFKESMTSLEAAKSIEKGFKAVLPDAEYVNIPVADGGEGTVQALIDATGGDIVRTMSPPVASIRA